ncbi:hypothetical protein NS365_13355 [Aureimonas ureilytica]|uniref:Portal protein n=1 Tax=Aureimonas ureilytica TaxID=401562 RepID=A0A175RQD4_9HYPH|nr:hypothetical protein [Aureimonas ureilytica]KTR05009.1 hypothetical protein NS365_13355 [Aureimonas ureilytica]
MSKTADSQTDQGRALRDEARKWLGRIEDAGKREKNWLEDAAKATAAYTGERSTAENTEAPGSTNYDFNILFANVETIVPAVINSAPAPDVRRRYGSDDPVAKDFAEMLERAIRVQVDDGKLQVEMEGMAQDGFLAGRGLIRLRFHSDFVDADTGRAEMEERDEAASDAPAPVEPTEAAQQSNERISFEAVSWRDARHGPARRWSDVPWWAFRHAMQKEDISGFADAGLVSSQAEPGEVEEDDDADRIVWEVWDKRTKRVLFISAGQGTILKMVDDPLGLSNFFPIATPVQPIEVTGRLMPVNPFSIYRKLADELDITTQRIRMVTKQLRVKGWYGGDQTELQSLLDADDNEFVPIKDFEQWAQNGGIAGAIAFWPVEKLVVVLAELYKNRDLTKQAIYEITGISDIVRGASKAAETLGAQQIKAQWGSLRIQKMQRMMERAARDLFLMMAEIIPTKFSPATLTAMTEIQIEPTPEEMQQAPAPMPPQPTPQTGQPDPQAMQVFQQARQAKLQHLMQLQALMRQRVATYYRIDVETDSTIKADLTRQKQEATEFMTAASGYFAAVGPLVQQGALPMNVAVEIFSSFSRMFNLGKSVEDALDEMVAQAKEAAGQPKTDPAAEAAKAEQEGKAKLLYADLQNRAIDGQIKQATGQADIAGKQLDQDIKRMDLQLKGLDLEIKRAELGLKQRQLMTPPAPPSFGGPAPA